MNDVIRKVVNGENESSKDTASLASEVLLPDKEFCYTLFYLYSCNNFVSKQKKPWSDYADVL